MGKKILKIIVILTLLILVSNHFPLTAKSETEYKTRLANLTPENTVIVSNGVDARFSKDYSVLLKQLRLEWVVLENEIIPDSIKNKNIIILGHPDSEAIGAMIREVLLEEEIGKILESDGAQFIIGKENPWAKENSMIVCSGTDFLERRNSLEGVIRSLMAEAPPASDWIETTFQVGVDSSMNNYLARLKYQVGEELTIQDMEMDLEAKPPGKISYQQAAQDVERLFYLLSHGYSGYGLYNQNGEFNQAEARIIEELSSKKSWTADSLAELIYEHLSFMVDCHVSIGEFRFDDHSDFWYVPDLELLLSNDGLEFVKNNKKYKLVSIDDNDPSSFTLPSLSKEGEPVYRVGLISLDQPQSLFVIASDQDGDESRFKFNLERSDFDTYTKEAFEETVIGGIPVVRVSSFADYYSDQLSKFVENAANYRGEPVVIIDLRGNGGGNEHWPSSWIQKLTGMRPSSVFVFSELESKTSMMGRANAFSFWDYHSNAPTLFADDAYSYTKQAEYIENGTQKPQWTGTKYPSIPIIPNDTTVVVVTNDQVASAGEGFVMRMSQAENVWVVGENTMGALTFGNISLHQLPHTKLQIWLPININLFPDQYLREGVGLFPDLWVPAVDAVNYAVAAIRRGTITTYRPIPENVADQVFIPESPLGRHIENIQKEWYLILIFGAIGISWAFFMRKKETQVLTFGVVWLLFGIFYIENNRSIGYGFLVASLISIVWGGINILKARQKNR